MEQAVESFCDSTGSYIRIQGDSQNRIADSILGRQLVKGMLPLTCERVNGHRDYVYETTGYRSLDEVVDERVLSKRCWISILTQWVDMIESLESFFLDGDCLQPGFETLFLSTDGNTLGGIYIAEHPSRLTDGLQRIAERMLKLPEYDRETAEFIYRLHSFSMGPEVSRTKLMRFLKDESEEPMEKKELKTIPKPAKKHSIKKETHDRNEYIIPSLIILVGIIIPSVLMALGVFDQPISGRKDILTMIGAYVFFIATAGYGAWRLWPKPVPVIVWDDEDISACLLPQTSGYPVMPVISYPWKIGSDPDLADGVIDSEDVSDVHARLKREGTSLLLTDEESASGTCHNGRRLTPWEPQRLSDGDIIQFGSHGYMVEISAI